MKDELLKGTLALEGWIVDPAMQTFGNKRRESEGS